MRDSSEPGEPRNPPGKSGGGGRGGNSRHRVPRTVLVEEIFRWQLERDVTDDATLPTLPRQCARDAAANATSNGCP
jgi:hypothetical protein